MLAVGCFNSHDDRPSEERDLGAARDSAVGLDASTDCLPYPGPPTPEIRITAEEAECVGITAPECAGCHTRPEGWVLRPMDGSPSLDIDFGDAVAECIPDCRFD